MRTGWETLGNDLLEGTPDSLRTALTAVYPPTPEHPWRPLREPLPADRRQGRR
ncbi:hypothetical protein [Streptomyces sp. ST2-7A]|uniref:hypothetical protein n=1 Tax=Streptomyces sp. ST2-7A TaxID=2907214 RepID=UPI001F411163|nr:hypothetical protein [Streptomyces sp. ST2-7A]MCE7081693.1 hypothetical protein [Streptomyces sp. ST2-7A]